MTSKMDYKLRHSTTNVDNTLFIGHSHVGSPVSPEYGFCRLGNLMFFNGKKRSDLLNFERIDH